MTKRSIMSALMAALTLITSAQVAAQDIVFKPGDAEADAAKLDAARAEGRVMYLDWHRRTLDGNKNLAASLGSRTTAWIDKYRGLFSPAVSEHVESARHYAYRAAISGPEIGNWREHCSVELLSLPFLLRDIKAFKPMQEAAGTCKVGEKLVSEWNAMIQAGKLPTSSATACNTIIWLDINYDEVPFDLASALDLARHLARRAEIDGSEIGSWQSHATLAHDRLNMIVSRLCGR